LETIGCASTLAALGIQSQSASLLSASSPQSAGSTLARMDFSLLKGRTQFPYGLLIPQHVTERGLSDMLEEAAKEPSANGNLRFSRGLRMSGMKEEVREIDGSTQNGFLITFEGGKTVWTRYLVGADGSRSTVSGFLPLSLMIHKRLIRFVHSRKSLSKTPVQPQIPP
jgi:2-polyprenyl-6-methoxyphenol hydroxylase-like FAD-dependent oxidoreductase